MWGAVNAEYADGRGSGENCLEMVITDLFRGSSIPAGPAENQFLQGISHDGRVMRRVAASVHPDIYDAMRSDNSNRWPEAIAQSYRMAGIESRVSEALKIRLLAQCGSHLPSVWRGRYMR